MSYEVVEQQPKLGETKPYPNYRVVLINDNHNTFDHVAECLLKHIPGMSADRAWSLTLKVHNEGSAVVWVGPKEVAELYYELLKSEGLTTTLEPDV
ncbi:MAG: ATP-dependent Clp protease adapter ClpS [Candidatus Melainabacteria bacterium]|nr:ATP-dependent Clp protease adapter ClpS [Candidatus Melainabacteria bacterium]